jgi:hypothetical protein
LVVVLVLAVAGIAIGAGASKRPTKASGAAIHRPTSALPNN